MSAAKVLAAASRTARSRAVRSLWIGNFFQAHGAQQVCQELTERLRDAGWPTLTSSDYRNRPLRFFDMTSSVWRHRDEYDVAQVDAFSGASFRWAQACSEALIACGKPYVVTLHGGALPQYADDHPARVARLLLSAAAVTSPSAYLARRLRTIRPDIVEIPNPIDLTHYDFQLRRPFAPRILWLRSFHEIYDPRGAVDVLHGVLPVCPNACLVMVGADRGDGSLQRAQEHTRRLGLEERVRFAGPIPKSEVPRYLNEAEVFLNTSHIDNAPVSVIEAMASGLPVVSSNVGGIPDLLTHERHGLLFDPGDYRGMAAGVTRVVIEPGLAVELARRAREKARQSDWSLVLPRWQQLLARIADSR